MTLATTRLAAGRAGDQKTTVRRGPDENAMSDSDDGPSPKPRARTFRGADP
jgi:hypothetical protein